jgi:hypothetical protein
MEQLTIGKVIKMPCMRSWLCKYPNETILVTKQTLEALKQSAIGIPVIIDHPETPITAETIKTMPVVGRVADLHYDESGELYYAHFVIDDAEALKLIESGYGVSTAWYGDKYAGPGTFNNMPYDRELLEGRYEHLAIVQTPRYEMAVNPIFMNSIAGHSDNAGDKLINENKRSISMIGKVWKKLTSREEIKVNSGEEYSIEVDGLEVPLSEAIAAIAALKKNEKEDKEKEENKKKLNGEDTVDVDGEEMTVNELVAAYKKTKDAAKKNEDEEKTETKDEEKKENTDDKDADDKGEKKENSIPGETVEPDTTEKDLADEKARFNALNDAHLNSFQLDDGSEWLSLKERTDLGKAKYGSNK